MNDNGAAVARGKAIAHSGQYRGHDEPLPFDIPEITNEPSRQPPARTRRVQPPKADCPSPPDAGDDIPLPPEPPPDDQPSTADPRDQWRVIAGGAFILDEPDHIPALWGHNTQVLWAEGESLMIAGPQGVGKTTLVGQLVRALLGIGDPNVLDLPVEPVNRVLYLAMDRPRQIARSLGRQFNETDRTTLNDRLLIRRGPPPADLAARPELLVAMAEDLDTDVVIVDSVKDAALGLSNDEVGAAYNRARQHLLAAGRQLVDIHHTKKAHTHPRDKGKTPAPLSIDDIYGSTWLTAGCGSVIILTGDPGDPIVNFRHLKQPADELGPWRLAHDPGSGTLTIEYKTDLIALVQAAGVDGLTARKAAAAITGNPNPDHADIEKARRRLMKLTDNKALTRLGGGDDKTTAVWFLAETGSTA